MDREVNDLLNTADAFKFKKEKISPDGRNQKRGFKLFEVKMNKKNSP